MGRRQFAKNAESVRHFKLVSRSQNDPHADKPDASPLVLEPYVPPGAPRRTGLSPEELLEVPEALEKVGQEYFAPRPGDLVDADRCASNIAVQDYELTEEDLDGDCYFPRDGYNYEQHLKKVSGAKGGSGVVGVVLDAPQKPDMNEISNSTAATTEESEALRALAHADEYDELEDGALDELLPGGVVDPTTVLWGATAVDDDLPDLALFREMRKNAALAGIEGFDDENEGQGPHQETGTEDFRQFLAEEYGDEEIGACEEQDIEGEIDLETNEEILDEYLKNRENDQKMMHSIYEPQKGKYDDVPRVIEETKAIIERHYQEESDDETSSGEESEDESRTWDCETVLSTLSNLSNRPGKIGRINVVKKKAPALNTVAEGAEADKGDDQGK